MAPASFENLMGKEKRFSQTTDESGCHSDIFSGLHQPTLLAEGQRVVERHGEHRVGFLPLARQFLVHAPFFAGKPRNPVLVDRAARTLQFL